MPGLYGVVRKACTCASLALLNELVRGGCTGALLRNVSGPGTSGLSLSRNVSGSGTSGLSYLMNVPLGWGVVPRVVLGLYCCLYVAWARPGPVLTPGGPGVVDE